MFLAPHSSSRLRDGQPSQVLGAAHTPGIRRIACGAERRQVWRGGQVVLQQFLPQSFHLVNVGDREITDDVPHGPRA